MSEKIVNGIDVSECCFYNNGKCDNPNGMACNCINNAVCYFKELKCLQEELDIKEKMLDKFMIGSGETLEKLQKENEGLKSLNDFNVQKIEVLKEENEKLKADLEGETEQCQKWYQLETDKHFQMLKYEQALEEIRKKITPVCACCDNIDGFTTWDDCENVCEKGVIKYLKIIDEVLNDRD